MREELKKLIKETFTVKVRLPFKNEKYNIEKSSLTASNRMDYGFTSAEVDKAAKCIYNSIVDYCYNETEIDLNNLDISQKRALKTRMRKITQTNKTSALKYGFYGETIMNAVMQYIFSTTILIAKGKFINLTDRREATGYDAFHLVQNSDNIDFWFGEVKCYENYKSAITDLLDKMNTDLSKNYFNDNIIMILDKQDQLNVTNEELDKLIKKWEDQSFDLEEDIINKNFKIIIPCFIIFNAFSDDDYTHFKACIDQIEFKLQNMDISNEINAEIFFCFLPIRELRICKEKVIEWILEEKSVIS